MALFKIFKGNNTAKITNSSATGYITPTDGYAYYDTSSKLFYIDAAYSGTTISRQSINADNATNGVFYGTCATGQGTKAKVATLTNGTGFSLKAGTIVAIKFTYASAASTMTLNVNSTGAKNLYQYGTTLMNSGTTTTGWPAGAIVPFVYDGTYWFRLYWTNTGTVTSITPGNGLLNGTGTSAITTTGTLNLNYGTSASAIGTTSAAGSANTVSRSDHVHSITLATGDNNGQVKIAGTNVSVKGLGSNAYTSTAYAPLASPALTGTPTAPTPAATSNDTTIATTAFVMNAFTANDAMVFKGVVNENGDLPATHKQGWTYRVATAGTYAGKVCEVGDMIVCVTDGTAATDAHWAVIQNNIDGAVYRGTNAFTDANVIVADSTNGKVKSSGKTITTTAPSSSAADTTIPTSKAVWSAISGASGYGKTGTVTSVRVQATAPIVSSSSAAATTSLNTTISLAATSANYIIAGPTSGTATAVPTYRKLVAADIPSLTKSKISDFPTNISAFTNDSGYVKSSGVTSITLKAGTGISLDTDNTAITTTGTRTITNAGVTGIKGNAESTYKTGQVNLTAAHIGAIPADIAGNTQGLSRPSQLNGLNDITLDSKINDLRANRLAFLPADQIIIEKTTDGGTTWTDAGISDGIKVSLFSETRPSVDIPLLNNAKNVKCGLRITFTAMKYNVPAGTAETQKYNYWNSNYIVSQERYNQLKEMYFWVGSNSDTISVKAERATGANSTTWIKLYDSDENSYGMTGWSGNDYIKFSQGVFGGGTTQTGNYWNYRLTFFTRGPGGSKTTLSGTNTSSAQVIQEIRGYGDTWWAAGNTYASKDHLYSFDYSKNATFPAKVTATGGFVGNVTGNVSGSAGSVAWSGITGKPTTISGYGITDAKIANGVITLGGNTITPLTSHQDISGKADKSATVSTLTWDSTNKKITKTINSTTSDVVQFAAGSNVTLTGASGKLTIAATDTDTKNTAGSTDTSSKIYLIGATSQATNPQTYSDNEVFATSGVLTAKTFNSTALTASQAVSTDANKNLVSTNLTVSDPTAGTSGQINFIATISQNAQGKITATKQPVRTATTAQTGVIQINATNANSFINQLSTGDSTPADNDYFISQYVNGGTTTTTYHRRKVSTIWDYVKGKITAGTYWANIKISDAASYKATPEMATLKLNGNTSATAASTSNVTLVYDTTLQALNFVFA